MMMIELPLLVRLSGGKQNQRLSFLGVRDIAIARLVPIDGIAYHSLLLSWFTYLLSYLNVRPTLSYQYAVMISYRHLYLENYSRELDEIAKTCL
jgi:hypothetical protein